MKTASKLSSFLLIAALAVTTQSMGSLVEPGHAAAMLAAPAQRTAMCHHQGAIPNSAPHSPRPLSYQCCLTGHDVAVVRAVHVAPPLVQYSRGALPDEMATTLSQLTGSEVWIVVSPDPPGITPLRI